MPRAYKHGKAIQYRADDGSFRRLTGDDVVVGDCPKCRSLTLQPPEPAELKSGFVDPDAFNSWRQARHCPDCGWKNGSAIHLAGLLPAKTEPGS